MSVPGVPGATLRTGAGTRVMLAHEGVGDGTKRLEAVKLDGGGSRWRSE